MDKLRQFFGKINIGACPSFDEPMTKHTTMRIGGPADAWIAPFNREDFLTLLRQAHIEGIQVSIIGRGANILVGDHGIRGIVACTENLRTVLFSSLSHVQIPDTPVGILKVEAGLSVDELCLEALSRGLAGFDDFYGMPGSLGGAIFMNARCYDTEIANLAPEVTVASQDGMVSVIPFDQSGWSYKHSPFQSVESIGGSVILSATFSLAPGEPSKTAKLMRERRMDRERKGHYRLPSAGSVFKNDRRFGRSTGAILDSLGFRGRTIGDAMVSESHANIFVNTGHATASDMRMLIESAQSEAKGKLGFELEPELIMTGVF